jgi:hypothetical protein
MEHRRRKEIMEAKEGLRPMVPYCSQNPWEDRYPVQVVHTNHLTRRHHWGILKRSRDIKWHGKEDKVLLKLVKSQR